MRSEPPSRPSPRFAVFSMACLLLAAGCSCGTQSSTTTTSQTVNGPSFLIGTDAPMASVTSFLVQIQGITGTDANNNTVALLSGSPTVDFARFNGLQTLLDMNDVAVGTYSKVTITLGAATIGYLDTSTAEPTICVLNESIAIQRGLPEIPLNRNYLARSLNAYSVLLGKMDRDKEAFAAMNESVSIRRELAKANPSAYEPELASALQNHAEDLREANQLQDAERVGREAVAIQTRLAAANPDAYRPALANALGILGNIYDGARRYDEAEAAHRQSVDIYRELTGKSPVAFEGDLARSLGTLGIVYDHAGRSKDAEASYREAFEIFLRLSQSSYEVYGQDMANTATSLGGIYMQAKDYERAEPFFRQTVDMSRRLAPLYPSYFRPLLAYHLQFLAFIYVQRSEMDKVGPVVEEAVEIFKQLAASDPAKYGDSLASEYYLESQSLESKDPAWACKLIGLAADAACKPEMKQGLQNMFQDCSQNAAAQHPQ